MSVWWEIRSRPWLGPAIGAFGMVLWYLAPLLVRGCLDYQEEAESNRKQAKLGRTVEIQQLRNKDPVKALELLETIVAAPKHKDEQRLAAGMLPEVVAQVYYKRVQDKEYDQAETLFQRMRTQWPGQDQTRAVTADWGNRLSQRIQDAIRGYDEVMVQKLYREYLATGKHVPVGASQEGESHVLEAYSRYKFEQWRGLPSTDRSTGKGLEMLKESTTSLLRFNQVHHRVELLRKDPPIAVQEIAALAERFEKDGAQEQAFNLYGIARSSFTAGLPWTPDGKPAAGSSARGQTGAGPVAMLDYKLATLACGLAVKMYAKADSVICPLPPATFLDEARHYIESPIYDACVLDQKLAIQTADYITFTEPLMLFDMARIADESYPQDEKGRLGGLLGEARRRLEGVDATRRALLDAWIKDTNATLWTKVDASVISEVERKIPPGTHPQLFEQVRRDKLREMVREDFVSMPVAVPEVFVKRMVEVQARQGVVALLGTRESGIASLRPILRTTTDPSLKARIQQAVQKALVNSRKKDDFQALIELAGFYASEYGDQMGRDPFRDEYRTTLESAAARFLTTDNMKYIFVEALLAAAFPGEDAGRKAQQETMDRAFRAVEHVPARKEGVELSLPSGLAGYSCVAVDNSTEYHILMCYDGPEKFAVLCNPYRKGSILLRNGAYRVAVITPSGSIQPYREENAFSDQFRVADYHVVEKDGRGRSYNSRSGLAMGSYVILRAPADLAGTKVDVKSGMVTR